MSQRLFCSLFVRAGYCARTVLRPVRPASAPDNIRDFIPDTIPDTIPDFILDIIQDFNWNTIRDTIPAAFEDRTHFLCQAATSFYKKSSPLCSCRSVQHRCKEAEGKKKEKDLVPYSVKVFHSADRSSFTCPA